MLHRAQSASAYSASLSGRVWYSRYRAATISFSPLLEVVWPGKHHIWGPPTTTSQHPAPATLHPYGWVHTLWQVIRYNSYEFCEAARVLLLIGETDTVEVLILRYGAEAIEHLFQSGRDASEMPCLVLLNPNMPRLESFRIL
jgi:hypothetical protein